MGTNPKACIFIFAKPPIPGYVKTRLATEIGAETSAKLALHFFRDTWDQLREIPWVWPVAAVSEDPNGRLGLGTDDTVWLQGGGELNHRLERIFQRALKSTDTAMAIGADTPGLPRRFYEEARRALQTHDAVIGPCEDGGFYLLGLRTCPDGLLDDVPWSESDTCQRTMKSLEKFGLKVKILPEWFDVDRMEDLERLRRLLEKGELEAPRTKRALAMIREPTIDIIIPTLNEELRIGSCLKELSSLGCFHRIIVADGGSSDRTVEIVRSFPEVVVVQGDRGRAAQMNAGAELSDADVLLFLHADVRLPSDASEWIRQTLRDERVIAGAFRTWTVPDNGGVGWAPLLHLADIRSRYARLPYGDQAIFVRVDAFRKVRGFPKQELMEDLELSRRLRKIGKVKVVPASVQVSGRRFLKRPFYYTFLVNAIPLLYRAGMSPRTLAKIYGTPR